MFSCPMIWFPLRKRCQRHYGPRCWLRWPYQQFEEKNQATSPQDSQPLSHHINKTSDILLKHRLGLVWQRARNTCNNFYKSVCTNFDKSMYLGYILIKLHLCLDWQRARNTWNKFWQIDGTSFTNVCINLEKSWHHLVKTRSLVSESLTSVNYDRTWVR